MGVPVVGSTTGREGMRCFSPPAPSPGYLPARRRRGARANARAPPVLSGLRPMIGENPGARKPLSSRRPAARSPGIAPAGAPGRPRRGPAPRSGPAAGRGGNRKRERARFEAPAVEAPAFQLDRQDFAGACNPCNTQVTPFQNGTAWREGRREDRAGSLWRTRGAVAMHSPAAGGRALGAAVRRGPRPRPRAPARRRPPESVIRFRPGHFGQELARPRARGWRLSMPA